MRNVNGKPNALTRFLRNKTVRDYSKKEKQKPKQKKKDKSKDNPVLSKEEMIHIIFETVTPIPEHVDDEMKWFLLQERKCMMPYWQSIPYKEVERVYKSILEG